MINLQNKISLNDYHKIYAYHWFVKCAFLDLSVLEFFIKFSKEKIAILIQIVYNINQPKVSLLVLNKWCAGEKNSALCRFFSVNVYRWPFFHFYEISRILTNLV